MTGRRFFGLALVAVAVVAAGAYFWTHQTRQQRGGRNAQGDGPVPVIAAVAKRADVPVYLDGVGTIRALNTVTVRSQVDGKLISVAYTEGQDVQQGYVLARIDPTTYQAAYDQAVAKKAQDEAMLANANIDLQRYTNLATTNSIARQQLDTQKATVAGLEAQVKLDQAQIDNAKAILAYTNIIAPLTGRTGIRLVDEGNIVHASDTTGIVIITQLQPLSILFTLPQQNLGQINRAAAKGVLPVDAFGEDNKTVIDRGVLKVVDNQVDQTTGTIKLKAEFSNAEYQLWPGGFVNVRILVDTLKQVVVAPTAAIQRGPTGTFVFVVQPDNTVKVVNITIGQQDEAQTVITKGVDANQRLVTTGFARLTDGAAVTVSNAEDASSPGAPQAAPRPDRQQDGRRGRRNGAAPSASQ